MISKLKGKTILVTGATGFVGGNLVDRLLKEKAKVRILVRRGNNKFSKNRKVKMFISDITDPTTLVRAMKKVDIVYHVAAALPYHNLSKEKYWEINVLGTDSLIKEAIKNKVKKFIHVSTVGIYGDKALDVDEKTKFSPMGNYSTSKLEGEEIVRKYKNKIGVVIIRPTLAYGPGDTRPVFFRLFKLVKKGVYFPIGSGKNYFHTLYIANLIDALILSAVRKEAIGEDFIIGDDPCPRFIDIEKIIFKVIGRKFPHFYFPKEIIVIPFIFIGKVGQISFITNEKKYKIAKAKKILGYKASVSIEDGLKQTYKWYKKEKLI